MCHDVEWNHMGLAGMSMSIVFALMLAWTMSTTDCLGNPETALLSWTVDAGMIQLAGYAPSWVPIGWNTANPGQDVMFDLPPCDPAPGESCAWRLIVYNSAGSPDTLCQTEEAL